MAIYLFSGNGHHGNHHEMNDIPNIYDIPDGNYAYQRTWPLWTMSDREYFFTPLKYLIHIAHVANLNAANNAAKRNCCGAARPVWGLSRIWEIQQKHLYGHFSPDPNELAIWETLFLKKHVENVSTK